MCTPLRGFAGVLLLCAPLTLATTSSAAPTLRPSAVRSVHVTYSHKSARVSWVAAVAKGNATITKYVATAHPSGSTCSTKGLSCSISGLGAHRYYFTVTDFNSSGQGTTSTHSNSIAVAPARQYPVTSPPPAATTTTAPPTTTTSPITTTTTTPPGSGDGSGGGSPTTTTTIPVTTTTTLVTTTTSPAKITTTTSTVPHTVSFDANGGAGTMANETHSNAASLTANSFNRVGYTFSDWNAALNGSGTSYANGADYPFASSVTLYAQWTIDSITVTFNANGATGAMAAQAENYGTATALSPVTFTEAGYSFTSWNTAANGSGSSYADVANYPFTSSMALYAQWSVLAPTVTNQPTTQLALNNTVTTFNAGTSAVVFSTQWQVSTNRGSSWSNISGATMTSLNILATSSTNDNQYRCVFTNASGSATTNAATLVYIASSNNWSGYVDTGATFSGVSGSWTVPSATCAPSGTSYASQWVGIDGWGNSTVEQDGTLIACSAGVANYSAWYEMYGDTAVNNGASVPLDTTNYPVHAGDAMSASVTAAAGQWTLNIADATQNWAFSIPETFAGASQASAEWVIEAPTQCVGSTCTLTSLSNFGTTTFTNATDTVGGVTGSITAAAYFAVQMVNGSTVLSLPGLDYSGGSAFLTSWEAA